jgi:hypothetical protein
VETGTIDETTLRRYLLGQLSEQEEVSQEEQLLTEASYYQRLVLAEDDLIDDYVRGKLSVEDRERIEERFLASPRRREKLRTAQALAGYASQRARPAGSEQGLDLSGADGGATVPTFAGNRGRVTLLGFAAAALLFIALATGLLFEIGRLRSGMDALNRDQMEAKQREEALRQELDALRQRSEQLAAELAREQDHRLLLEQDIADRQRVPQITQRVPETALISLNLNPGRIRDTGVAAAIEILPTTRWVRLRLTLERGGYDSYRAILQTAEGKRVWTGGDLSARRINDDLAIEVVLPARLLVPGEYTLQLSPSSGPERIGTYYFTARKKQ